MTDSAPATAALTREQVFAVIRARVLEVLPGLDPDQITPDRSMRGLGANSMDRLDVVVASQEDLGLRVSAGELSEVADLGALAAVLHDHLEKRAA